MLAFRTNLKSTWPTMQALGSTSSNTCSSQLELQKEHGSKNIYKLDITHYMILKDPVPVQVPYYVAHVNPFFLPENIKKCKLPITLKLPGAGVLGCISMVLLVKMLWVASLLLLLLHLHPARRHCGREAGGQCLKTRQLHQRHQALRGQRLVHQEVHSCTKESWGTIVGRQINSIAETPKT